MTHPSEWNIKRILLDWGGFLFRHHLVYLLIFQVLLGYAGASCYYGVVRSYWAGMRDDFLFLSEKVPSLSEEQRGFFLSRLDLCFDEP